MLRWYLIRTKPAAEATAQANLQRQGFEIYLPRVLSPVRRRGRWRDTVSPLFPRYLFLRLQEGLQALGPVRSSIGVSDLVRFGSRYAVVPDPIVEALRARADAATGLHRLALPAPLAIGAPVRIGAGAFEGLHGIFQRRVGSDRVSVLLNLLGHDASVQIPADFVWPDRAA
jgi:transcriptional antiterminator RfaH